VMQEVHSAAPPPLPLSIEEELPLISRAWQVQEMMQVNPKIRCAFQIRGAAIRSHSFVAASDCAAPKSAGAAPADGRVQQHRGSKVSVAAAALRSHL